MKNICTFFLTVLVFIPTQAKAHEFAHVSGAPFLYEQKKKTPFGFKLNLGYKYEHMTAGINREWQGDGSLKVVRDLLYKRTTSTMNVGVEMGVKGFALFMNLPIVLASSSSYTLTPGNLYPGYADFQACLLRNPGDTAACNPDGVSLHNSRTVQDGIVSDIYDPANASSIVPFDGSAGPRSILKSPNRKGIDQLHLGFRFNVPVFNNITDKTKPFWILSFDVGLPVGTVMDFKRTHDGQPQCGSVACSAATQRPDLNTAVGRGVYDITLASTMAKTEGIFDSYFKLWATLPFAYSNDSLYRDKFYFPNWGMKKPAAPIKGGIDFGTDFNVYTNVEKKVQINLFLRAQLKGVFQGQDYSEAYELLAGSPALYGPNTWSANGLTNFSELENINYYPGMTTVENYAVMGGQLGVNVRVNRYFFAEFTYGLKHMTEHFLTYTDAGIDDGTQANDYGRINLGTQEANPYYRPVVDQVGNRYRIQESLIHTLMLKLYLMY